MPQHGDLTDVLDALRAANEALLSATDAGDSAEVRRLLDDVAALERRRNRLIHKSHPEAVASPYESAVPVRDQIIRALGLTGRPSSARLLSEVTTARWGERVDTSKLSSLRRDEVRSWRKTRELPGRQGRDVYVVPALAFDRLTPVRGTVALSNWPTNLRLIAPLSPRVDMLHSTIALAEATSKLAHTNYEPGMLRLVSRLGATIPGVELFDSDPQSVIEAARSELREIEPTDEMERSDAAKRAEGQLDDEQLLFGTQIRALTSRAAGRSR